MARSKNLLSKILVVTLALIVSACAGNKNTFRLKGEWTDWEIVAAQDAFDEWCDVSEGKYCATISDENDGSELVLSDLTAEETGRAGYYQGRLPRPVLTVYRNRQNKEWLNSVRLVVLHELGHHFRGHGHLPEGNVMQPCTNNVNSLTKADLESPYSTEIKTCEDAKKAAGIVK